MNGREQELNKYLQRIAENLDISDTMYEKAVDSYSAVGKWLGECADDTLVKILPQGSFCLGTVIKPVSDDDDYDIDLVCLLSDKHEASSHEIKNLVGDWLKQHGTYKEMLDKKEGKRCWTLHYEEFHMDILPCVPKEVVYVEPHQTKIRLTHMIAPHIYEPKYSNPYKYHEWFEERMIVRLREARYDHAIKAQVEITDVPLYKVKTPLQRAIQLLKRHRDIMYEKALETEKANAPISIIINTLAAHAYNNENSIFEALRSILTSMHTYIENRNGVTWIENPALPEENFADKWKDEPQKQYEFFRWLEKARYEILVAPSEIDGLHKICETMEKSFGSNIVRRSFADVGNDTRKNREGGELRLSGLSSGLTTTVNENDKKVENHTFFGR